VAETPQLAQTAPIPAGGAATAPRALPVGRLGYLPGVDGLRAVSVVAVLAYHAGLTWIPGGFLGVEVFFVISGYLITSLLLSEHRAAGTISLKAFWHRRARRLLPAAYAVLFAVASFAATFARDEQAPLRAPLVAALGYASNWYLVVTEASYFATDGRPSPLQHLWSLAIEEQFYLAWPLVVLGLLRLFRGRRWPLGLLVAGGAAASALAMAALYRPALDPSRVYYGTDTRAQGLLLGALLGLIWRPGRARRERVTPAPLTLELAGLVGLAGLIAAFSFVHDYEPRLYRGGFTLIGVLSILAIAACTHPGSRLARRLGWAPLAWIGTRSYGLYLWHWPIFVFTRPGIDVPWGAVPTLALRLALTVLAAEASFRFLEGPVRSGAIGRWLAALRSSDPARRRLRWRGVKVAAVGCLAVVLPVTVSLALASNSLGRVERAVQEGEDALPGVDGQSEPQLSAPVLADEPVGTVQRTGPIDPTSLKNRNVTVLADSVLLGARSSVVKELGADGWNVEYQGRPAWMLHKASAELAQARRPVGSVVVIGLGYNSLWERNRARFSSWAAKFDREADELVEVLRQLGAERIVWVLLREPTLDVLPPEGKVGYDKYAWFFPYANERLKALKDRQPDVILVDWAGVSNKRGITYDAIHLTSAGIRLMIDSIRSTTGM